MALLGENMGSETLCWECANFAKCSWSRGVPVEGWDATKTKIISEEGEMCSFCVHSCPQFKEEEKRRKSVKEIGAIIGISKSTMFRYLERKKGRLKIRELLKIKGYKLHMYNDVCNDEGKEIRRYYLEKLGG